MQCLVASACADAVLSGGWIALMQCSIRSLCCVATEIAGIPDERQITFRIKRLLRRGVAPGSGSQRCRSHAR